MDTEQPTSEEKNAVFVLARNPSHGFVGAVSWKKRMKAADLAYVVRTSENDTLAVRGL
jgi:hypothetical protein